MFLQPSHVSLKLMFKLCLGLDALSLLFRRMVWYSFPLNIRWLLIILMARLTIWGVLSSAWRWEFPNISSLLYIDTGSVWHLGIQSPISNHLLQCHVCIGRYSDEAFSILHRVHSKSKNYQNGCYQLTITISVQAK